MCKAVIHYHKRKLLRRFEVLGKAEKVSKTANALDIRRLPAPLKTSKRFLWQYVKQASNNSRISWDILGYMSLDTD
ncbi:hypothetical protein TNCV_716231 [Trichonephila clavipes]|nr:hypothetical protein TNCV_716231 [Trichonephila clavipes]